MSVGVGGTTIAVEDKSLSYPSDRDYNDLIFDIKGATGKLVSISDEINSHRDWRNSTVGKQILDYASGVVNSVPDVDAGGDVTVSEGENVSFNGSFTDTDVNDTHTVEWDFGDGSSVEDTLAPTHTYSQNGDYTVTMTVTDSDGNISSDRLTVTVNNVAPTIAEINGDTNIVEGDTANFSAIATDPGIDNLTYTWDFGDGSEEVVGVDVSHVFSNNGVYNVTLTVTDGDGGVESETLTVTVENPVLTITEILGDTNINELATATFSAEVEDLWLDNVTYTWDFGDGSDPASGRDVNQGKRT